MKRLTLALPDDVWQRLADEADAHGTSIGTHVKNLIVARDSKRQEVKK